MSPRAAWRLDSLGFEQIYDYVAGKADWSAAGLPREGKLAGTPRAGQLARRDVPTCGLKERVSDVRERLRAAGCDTCAIVNEGRVLLGLLHRRTLEGHAAAVAEDIMDPGPSTFRPDIPVEALAHYMHHHELSRVWITTSDGEQIGLLLRTDLERRLAELEAAADDPGQPAEG
jgi:CBS domain-containing protein